MKKLGKREKVKVLRRTHWLRRKLEFFLFVLLKFLKGVRCNEYEISFSGHDRSKVSIKTECFLHSSRGQLDRGGRNGGYGGGGGPLTYFH